MVIRCPKCSKGLKLKDPSKLGKKARCPKCKHVFVMQAPPPGPDDDDDDSEEIQMELAQPATPAQPSAQQPVEGTGGQWVPDDAPVGQVPMTPVGQDPAPIQVVPQTPGQFSGVVAAPAAQPQSLDQVAQQELGGVAALNEVKRKGAKRRKAAIIAGILTACAVTGVVYAAKTYLDDHKQELVDNARPKRDEDLADSKDALRGQRELAQASSPTQGGPISTKMLPLGCKIIISIHPAELWAEGSKGQELIYCLGPFGEWIGQEIERVCLYPPDQIEHAIIGVITGQVGEAPQVAAVVRLTEDQKKSQLITKFGSQTDEYGYPVYVDEGNDQAAILKDLRTIAIAPFAAAEELANSTEFANPQSDGIDAIIEQTDSQRHITVVFEPIIMSRHRATLFHPDAADLVEHSLRFFNDVEIESVAWSMHLGDRNFFSEILTRNTTSIREHLLTKEMSTKLKQMPFDMWKMVELMNPDQIGRRKLIGRFPAMMQMFSNATIDGIGDRYTQLTTQLPERAAPNLALAGLLTWDEAVKTDFSKAVPQRPTDSGPKLPDLLVDRLKLKIDVEFNREPLKDAFSYIAGECKVKVAVNGDALKDKGYTQNMPQTFTMQDSGLAAIKQIISAYEGMCIVLQEDKKTFIVTTTKFAEQDGQTPYEYK